eukprot:Gregarina_sp_Poly_1__8561@NODE_507_length_7855_cov_144_722779_g405_i0_p3_GENE_NODE_507_length_7855_cov_144_722779_g405_i0NODE_507_length_7855_cov_144_722779_g405_i0_p3_ORF_typecomplete_len385_score61_43MORN/PF02493_20/1_2MORN/PF02493_20/4_7e05MORN/PF02493_20/0_00011MORN/PF02493_20/6_8e06MORN/PF02493_20/1_9MORN/PF02493_20/1_3e06MORN/PF02493_20/5_3e07MORN/PF02493_20/0_12_NODE_507_length_7855_cov_144_722779_g405_i06441798
MGNCQNTEKRGDLCQVNRHEEAVEIKLLRSNESAGFALRPAAFVHTFDDQSTSTSGGTGGEEFDYDSPKSSHQPAVEVVQGLEPPVVLVEATACSALEHRLSSASGKAWKYKGETHHGKANGYGIYEDDTGSRYEGFWKENRAHGMGKYTRKNGSWYNGDWENNLQHGQGEEHWPDGQRYEGAYVHGLKTGQGKFVWADGSYYCGELKDNLASGFGEHYWAEDGKKYQGDWVRNTMHGWGRMEWADGSVFDGEFQDDRRHGYGRFVWPSGTSFVGFWERGLQHGRGVVVEPDGRRKRGYWDKGVNILWETDSSPNITANNDQCKISEGIQSPPYGPTKSTSKETQRPTGLGYFRQPSEPLSPSLLEDLLRSPAFSHLDSEFESN